ncbi:MAG: hypothetical protein ACLFTQ_04200 [Candidatus Aenigmatarchaeota archaeon]
MSQKMKKRIPVSEEAWKKLGRIKGAGETYDELLKQMIQEHNRVKLMEKMKEAEEADKEELVSLDEL